MVDIPAWLSAIAALFGLVFVAIAAFAALRVYKIESERDEHADRERRRRDEFERRAQAALVSAWWGYQDDASDRGRLWGAFVRNASETPTYQNRVWVTNLHQPDMGEAFTMNVLPPAGQPTFCPSRLVGAVHADSSEAPGIRVAMTFTDASGIRWIRDKQGQLSEVLPNLSIWTDSQRATLLELFSEDFLSDHGVTVTFRRPPIETLQTEFMAAVAAGKAPDVLIGPHDWIGELADQGVIEPLSMSEQQKTAFLPRFLDAMTYDENLYGVPFAGDSVALIRNLDLAPDPPTSMEELLESGRSLCAAGRADEPLALQVGTGDGFYIYPIFTSSGGSIFQRTSGNKWDREVIAGTGSRRAFQRLAELGERGARVLRCEVTRERAVQLFTEGRTPYFVCAPWGLGPAREAGIRLGVSPVPPFSDGTPARSLVAVQGFFFPTAGRNKEIARDLVLDFLTRIDTAEKLFETQPRHPALVAAIDRFYARDPLAAAYRDQFERGELIPSTPDVARLWKAFHKAETDAISGLPLDTVMRELSRSIDSLNRR